jgi:hypothetical protein
MAHRLAEARAKTRWAEVVERSDVAEAIRLMNVATQKVPFLRSSACILLDNSAHRLPPTHGPERSTWI